jgi:hypothetical protein
MLEQIFNLAIFLLSLTLIVYNINIYKAQKTPVQQNWLSTGLAIQIPILFLYILKPAEYYVLSSYIIYLSVVYGLLYSSKFCISCKKGFIKKYILFLSSSISLIYILVNIELFRKITCLDKVGYLKCFYEISHFIVILITLATIIFNVLIIVKEYKSVKNTIFIFRTLLCLCLFVTTVSICFDSRFIINFARLILVFIDLVVLKIIWIDKGRFYKND